MNFSRKNMMRVNLIAIIFTLPLSSLADFSWTFDSNPNQGICQDNSIATVGNTCTQVDTDNSTTVKVTASAWATSTTNVNSNLEEATLKRWDGLAVNAQGESTDQPEHAADNNGKYEAILFSFDNSVANVDVELTSVTMGWHQDSDFSLLAYTGNGNPNSLDNQSYSSLLNNGWELVSNNFYHSGQDSSWHDITSSDESSSDYNHGNNSSSTSGGTFNGNHISSSLWLVAGINGAFFDNSCYIGNDYFKLKTLTGIVSNVTTPPSSSVPEPSTLALALFGFTLLMIQRRKKNKEEFTLKA